MVGDEHREVQITLNRKSEARLGASSVWFVCRNSGVPSLLTALVTAQALILIMGCEEFAFPLTLLRWKE